MSAEPPDTGPPPASRNILPLAARALMVGVRGNVLYTILQPFVLNLGASVAFLGLLESIGGYRGLVPTLVLPLGGWLADRSGRKRIIILASIATTMGLLLLALAGTVRAVPLLVPAVMLLGLNGLGRPAAEALVGESAGPERVGYAYGQISLAWALAGVVAPLASGYLADLLGFPRVFALTAGLEVVGAFVVIATVSETLTTRRRARLERGEVRRLTIGLLAPPPHLRALYLAIVLDTFSYGLGSALLYGFWADRFGYTPLQFGILTTAFSVSWVVVQLPAARWADRGRAKELLVIAELLNVAAIVAWLVSSSFEVFVGSMVVLGIVAALWSPALMAWVYIRVPELSRAEELGRVSAVPGFFALPAPWIGGLLYDRLGYAVPLALNLLGALAATAVLIWGLEKPDGKPRQDQGGDDTHARQQ